MKTIPLSTIAALGLLAFDANDLTAQDGPSVDLTVKATALIQSGTTDDGTTTTTAAPSKKSITTKLLLEQLAADEFMAANWPSNTFPKGVKLTLTEGHFLVVKGTNVLIDVSDILSVGDDGDNEVVSGKENNAHGIPAKHTRYELTTFVYDSTPGGGMLKFRLTGLGVTTTTDTAPNASGFFTETVAATIQSATGEGITPGGTQMVLTGTVTAKGKARLSVGP